MWLLPAALPQSAPPSGEPIAIIGGKPIYEHDLLPYIQPQLLQLHSQEYDLRSKYLDALINQRLAEAEATKHNTTVPKLMDAEVNSKVADPTDAEIDAFYKAQKDRINRPLAEVKDQIRQSLKQDRIQQASETYFKALRKAAGVEVLLDFPRIRVDVDRTRIRGNPDAPVTIVEFTDFQCPFCLAAETSVRAVLAKYDGKVRLAFRDFPLQDIHQHAESAAEAARCAAAQGKFWEYHDLIFANQSKIAHDDLVAHARQLKLDAGVFEACLASGKFKEAIDRDAQEASRLGVSGTPGFFVDGIFLNGAQPPAVFERIIDTELALKKRLAAR